MKHKNTVPTPPDAWLVVCDYGFAPFGPNDAWMRDRGVVGRFPSRDDPQLLAQVEEYDPSEVSVLPDAPSLDVSSDGILITNASCLSARDNWFHRFESVLESIYATPGSPMCTPLRPVSYTTRLPRISRRQGPLSLACRHAMADLWVLWGTSGISWRARFSWLFRLIGTPGLVGASRLSGAARLHDLWCRS
jgi:hypothetical protein